MIKDKYKIRIDASLKTDLIRDMYRFNFFKPNESVNQNKFYSMVLMGMCNYMSYDIKIAFDILSETFPKDNQNKLKDIANKINLEILKFHHNDNFSTRDESIYIQTTKENKQIINFIENNLLKDQTFSELVRSLFISYTRLPIDIREMIAKIDIYRELTFAVDNSKEIHITTIYGETYLLRPYDVIVDKNQLANHIVGDVVYSVDDTVEYKSFILSELDSVFITDTFFEFSEERLNFYKNKLYQNVNYITDDDTVYKIQLDETGIDIFIDNDNSPIYKSWDEATNILTFECDEKVIFNFLKLFGKHAKVIEPLSLKEKLYEFHKSAIEKE